MEEVPLHLPSKRKKGKKTTLYEFIVVEFPPTKTTGERRKKTKRNPMLAGT